MNFEVQNQTQYRATVVFSDLAPGTEYMGTLNNDQFSFSTLSLPAPPTVLLGTIDCNTGDEQLLFNTINANLEAVYAPGIDGIEFEVAQRINGQVGPVMWRGSGTPNSIGDYIGINVFHPVGDLIIRLRSVIGDVRGEYAEFICPMAALQPFTTVQVDGKAIVVVNGPHTKLQYRSGTNTNDATPIFSDIPWPVEQVSVDGDLTTYSITLPKWGSYQVRAVWDNGNGLVVFGKPRQFDTALGESTGLSIAEVEDLASGGIRVRCVQDLSNGAVPQWSIAKLQFSQDGINFGRVQDIAHNPEDIIERAASLWPEAPGYDFTWSDWTLPGDRIWLRIAYGHTVENNSTPHGQAQSNIVEHVWGSNPEA